MIEIWLTCIPPWEKEKNRLKSAGWEGISSQQGTAIDGVATYFVSCNSFQTTSKRRWDFGLKGEVISIGNPLPKWPSFQGVVLVGFNNLENRSTFDEQFRSLGDVCYPIVFWCPEKIAGWRKRLIANILGCKFGGDNFCARQPPKAGEAIQWSDKPMAEKEGKENQGVLLGTPRNDNNSAWVNPKKDGSSFDEATYFQPGSWRNFPQENGRKQSNSGWKMGFWSKTHTFPDIGDQWIAWHGDIFIFAFIDSAEKAE